MLNRISILTVACLAVSSSLYVADRAIGEDMTTNTTVTIAESDAALPEGIAAKDLNSDKAIEKTFKAITEDAMDKSGLDSLVDRMVDQDRVRIRKTLSSGTMNNINGSKNTNLNDVISRLQATWKTKYNQKFDMDIAKVFSADFIHIQTGEVVDSNLLVGKWPVGIDVGKATQRDIDKANDKLFGGDVNLEKGRYVAIAHIYSSSHNMVGLNASMIHEAGGWKFDVPNNLSAQTLYDNLVNNLSYLDSHADQWPNDVNETYRKFAHAVTAAIYDRHIGVDIKDSAASK